MSYNENDVRNILSNLDVEHGWKDPEYDENNNVFIVYNDSPLFPDAWADIHSAINQVEDSSLTINGMQNCYSAPLCNEEGVSVISEGFSFGVADDSGNDFVVVMIPQFDPGENIESIPSFVSDKDPFVEIPRIEILADKMESMMDSGDFPEVRLKINDDERIIYVEDLSVDDIKESPSLMNAFIGEIGSENFTVESFTNEYRDTAAEPEYSQQDGFVYTVSSFDEDSFTVVFEGDYDKSLLDYPSADNIDITQGLTFEKYENNSFDSPVIPGTPPPEDQDPLQDTEAAQAAEEYLNQQDIDTVDAYRKISDDIFSDIVDSKYGNDFRYDISENDNVIHVEKINNNDFLITAEVKGTDVPFVIELISNELGYDCTIDKTVDNGQIEYIDSDRSTVSGILTEVISADKVEDVEKAAFKDAESNSDNVTFGEATTNIEPVPPTDLKDLIDRKDELLSFDHELKVENNPVFNVKIDYSSNPDSPLKSMHMYRTEHSHWGELEITFKSGKEETYDIGLNGKDELYLYDGREEISSEEAINEKVNSFGIVPEDNFDIENSKKEDVSISNDFTDSSSTFEVSFSKYESSIKEQISKTDTSDKVGKYGDFSGTISYHDTVEYGKGHKSYARDIVKNGEVVSHRIFHTDESSGKNIVAIGVPEPGNGKSGYFTILDADKKGNKLNATKVFVDENHKITRVEQEGVTKKGKKWHNSYNVEALSKTSALDKVQSKIEDACHQSLEKSTDDIYRFDSPAEIEVHKDGEKYSDTIEIKENCTIESAMHDYLSNNDKEIIGAVGFDKDGNVCEKITVSQIDGEAYVVSSEIVAVEEGNEKEIFDRPIEKVDSSGTYEISSWREDGIPVTDKAAVIVVSYDKEGIIQKLELNENGKISPEGHLTKDEQENWVNGVGQSFSKAEVSSYALVRNIDKPVWEDKKVESRTGYMQFENGEGSHISQRQISKNPHGLAGVVSDACNIDPKTLDVSKEDYSLLRKTLGRVGKVEGPALYMPRSMGEYKTTFASMFHNKFVTLDKDPAERKEIIHRVVGFIVIDVAKDMDGNVISKNVALMSPIGALKTNLWIEKIAPTGFISTVSMDMSAAHIRDDAEEHKKDAFERLEDKFGSIDKIPQKFKDQINNEYNLEMQKADALNSHDPIFYTAIENGEEILQDSLQDIESDTNNIDIEKENIVDNETKEFGGFEEDKVSNSNIEKTDTDDSPIENADNDDRSDVESNESELQTDEGVTEETNNVVDMNHEDNVELPLEQNSDKDDTEDNESKSVEKEDEKKENAAENNKNDNVENENSSSEGGVTKRDSEKDENSDESINNQSFVSEDDDINAENNADKNDTDSPTEDKEEKSNKENNSNSNVIRDNENKGIEADGEQKEADISSTDSEAQVLQNTDSEELPEDKDIFDEEDTSFIGVFTNAIVGFVDAVADISEDEKHSDDAQDRVQGKTQDVTQNDIETEKKQVIKEDDQTDNVTK